MIYFLQRRDGAIKVGTTIHPLLRIQRQIGKDFSIEFLGIMSGGVEREHRLHLRYRAFKAVQNRKDNGNLEWFEPCEDLLTFIQTFTYKPPYLVEKLADYKQRRILKKRINRKLAKKYGWGFPQPPYS